MVFDNFYLKFCTCFAVVVLKWKKERTHQGKSHLSLGEMQEMLLAVDSTRHSEEKWVLLKCLDSIVIRM